MIPSFSDGPAAPLQPKANSKTQDGKNPPSLEATQFSVLIDLPDDVRMLEQSVETKEVSFEAFAPEGRPLRVDEPAVEELRSAEFLIADMASPESPVIAMDSEPSSQPAEAEVVPDEISRDSVVAKEVAIESAPSLLNVRSVEDTRASDAPRIVPLAEGDGAKNDRVPVDARQVSKREPEISAVATMQTAQTTQTVKPPQSAQTAHAAQTKVAPLQPSTAHRSEQAVAYSAVETAVGESTEKAASATDTARNVLAAEKTPSTIPVPAALAVRSEYIAAPQIAGLSPLVHQKLEAEVSRDIASLDVQLSAPTNTAERGSEIRAQTPSQQMPLVTGSALAREVTQAALAAKGGNTVELFLDPVELGKLEIEFSIVDDRMNIMVRADREDALDLMRRNSDELQRLLREANVDLGSLSFSQEHSGGHSDPRDFNSVSFEATGDASSDGSSSLPPITDSARLDMRV